MQLRDLRGWFGVVRSASFFLVNLAATGFNSKWFNACHCPTYLCCRAARSPALTSVTGLDHEVQSLQVIWSPYITERTCSHQHILLCLCGIASVWQYSAHCCVGSLLQAIWLDSFAIIWEISNGSLLRLWVCNQRLRVDDREGLARGQRLGKPTKHAKQGTSKDIRGGVAGCRCYMGCADRESGWGEF